MWGTLYCPAALPDFYNCCASCTVSYANLISTSPFFVGSQKTLLIFPPQKEIMRELGIYSRIRAKGQT